MSLPLEATINILGPVRKDDVKKRRACIKPCEGTVQLFVEGVRRGEFETEFKRGMEIAPFETEIETVFAAVQKEIVLF